MHACDMWEWMRKIAIASHSNQLVWAESTSQQCPCSKLISYNLLLSPPSAILAFAFASERGKTTTTIWESHITRHTDTVAIAWHGDLHLQKQRNKEESNEMQCKVTKGNQQETKDHRHQACFNSPLSPDTQHTVASYIYNATPPHHPSDSMQGSMHALMCHESSLHASLFSAPTSNHWLLTPGYLLAPIFYIQTWHAHHQIIHSESTHSQLTS